MPAVQTRLEIDCHSHFAGHFTISIYSQFQEESGLSASTSKDFFMALENTRLRFGRLSN